MVFLPLHPVHHTAERAGTIRLQQEEQVPITESHPPTESTLFSIGRLLNRPREHTPNTIYLPQLFLTAYEWVSAILSVHALPATTPLPSQRAACGCRCKSWPGAMITMARRILFGQILYVVKWSYDTGGGRAERAGEERQRGWSGDMKKGAVKNGEGEDEGDAVDPAVCIAAPSTSSGAPGCTGSAPGI